MSKLIEGSAAAFDRVFKKDGCIYDEDAKLNAREWFKDGYQEALKVASAEVAKLKEQLAAREALLESIRELTYCHKGNPLSDNDRVNKIRVLIQDDVFSKEENPALREHDVRLLEEPERIIISLCRLVQGDKPEEAFTLNIARGWLEAAARRTK